MLLQHAFLETRWRFLIGLVLLPVSAAFVALGYPQVAALSQSVTPAPNTAQTKSSKRFSIGSKPMMSAPETSVRTMPTTMWWRWTPWTLPLPQPRTRAIRVYPRVITKQIRKASRATKIGSLPAS